MGLIRLLFWLAVGALVVVAVKRLGAPRPGAAAAAPPPPAAEDMVRCAHCELNLPKSEAVACTAGWACSAAHARAANRADRPS